MNYPSPLQDMEHVFAVIRRQSYMSGAAQEIEIRRLRQGKRALLLQWCRKIIWADAYDFTRGVTLTIHEVTPEDLAAARRLEFLLLAQSAAGWRRLLRVYQRTPQRTA
jgi:hypothetical protein